MKTGDVIYVGSVTTLREGLQMTFKAPKGEAFVLLVLGTHDRPQMSRKRGEFTHFDAEGAMRNLGWQLEEEK